MGSDADLVVMDPDLAWTGGELPPASDDTFDLYDGYAGTGRARHVLVGGRIVVEDGAFVGGPGDGGFVARPPIAAVS